MDTFLGLDATLLARIQFGFTVSFHFIFPSISIGLASYLAVLNGLYLWTRDEVYRRVFNFWVKIFAIAFGMGVVSGIVMSYQFGTNWSVFSDLAGPVVGPLMAYEVLTAFFLEAGFLGIMLFGREKVGPGLHMFATAMVAVGTAISATWILSVNSWMQTPQGFGINADGQFIPEDWWAIVFTPSFPYRLAHTLTAAYLTTAFIVGGLLIGFATPTETAVVASIYAFVVGAFVYRGLKLRDVPRIIIDSAVSAAAILVLVGLANVFGWILVSERIPQMIANAVLNVTDNRFLVILLINLVLLFVGMFMETIAALIILFGPLLALATGVGVDPLHFAVFAVLNLMIGLTTPPVGVCLFICADIGRVSLWQVTRAIGPFLVTNMIVLMLVSYIPFFSTWLPSLLSN